jgi:hypothetical protein
MKEINVKPWEDALFIIYTISLVLNGTERWDYGSLEILMTRNIDTKDEIFFFTYQHNGNRKLTTKAAR